MIKLIIFDLDGVLVDSRDLHYDALNRALKDFGEDTISYKDHISKYDGKPTREKLALKGVVSDKIEPINIKKQSYTAQLLNESLTINDRLVALLAKLKEEKYTIHVASNSIRATVDTVLFNIGLSTYIDYVVSNEDVEEGKPHPEMYLKCMLQAKVGPRDTLIIEDSYVGRQAAFNSGAYLCAVKDPDEVFYELIKSSIDKANGIKPKWKDSNLNIVIPMAGAGSRFVQAGYTFPKPLIDVKGKPMIQVVVENLNIEGHYIFIVRKEHYDKYDMKHLLEILAPGCDILTVEELTEGAACTVLLAKDLINTDKQLIIVNSDQYHVWDSSHFMYSVQSKFIDGSIPTFTNSHVKWSYARADEDGFVQEVREKVVISNRATTGLYYFKKGSDFVKYAEQMIKKNIRVNNEFYVCPIFNEAIADGKKIKIYDVERLLGLGIPEDLNYFLSLNIDV